MKQPAALDLFSSQLELDPTNPGLNDPDYIARRTYFFNLAKACRNQEDAFPEVTFSDEEHRIWEIAHGQLETVHEEHACRLFLEGKKFLKLDPKRLPDLVTMNRRLERETGIGLIPAEGLISYPEFFNYLAAKKIPCTIYLRHGSHPEYATEPDLVHDVIGHFPFLADQAYVNFIAAIGQASQRAVTDEQLLALNRLYFYTIEFGLIEENNEVKVFGAGLLSSAGEIAHAYSDQVQWKTLDMDDLIKRPYDPYNMQDVLYVIPSFTELVTQTQALLHRVLNR